MNKNLKLTDKEWVKLTRIFVRYYNQGLRPGQSYMNALNDINPDLYVEITGTDADCFYDDNKLIDFMRYLNK